VKRRSTWSSRLRPRRIGIEILSTTAALRVAILDVFYDFEKRIGRIGYGGVQTDVRRGSGSAFH
jgi:hypothetical protein